VRRPVNGPSSSPAESPPPQTPALALDAGADGVIAGARFLMTHEANAHPEYQRRILDAETTMETTLFGLSCRFGIG
jgi:NAD(P)H-dependent flavin oxidoreductase YrpB (nitropropane dioxygenase family)